MSCGDSGHDRTFNQPKMRFKDYVGLHVPILHVHSLADQDTRLSRGSASERASGIFQMDDHADHALPESASRCARVHDGAFSGHLFNNLRIIRDIYQFGIISISNSKGILAPVPRGRNPRKRL